MTALIIIIDILVTFVLMIILSYYSWKRGFKEAVNIMDKELTRMIDELKEKKNNE